MASTVFIVIAVGLVGFLVVSRVRRARRSAGSEPAYILLYEANSWRCLPITVSALGLEVTPDEVYPMAGSSMVNVGRNLVYVVTIEPLALMEHRTLERARRTIVLGTIFKPGSDMYRYLQFGALIAPIIVCIWLTLQFGSVTGELHRLGVTVAQIQKWTESPLEIKRP